MSAQVTARPAPPDFSHREGLAWHVAPDPDWRVPMVEKRCRRIEGNPRHGCGKPAVAELNRGRTGRPSWWAYCADHLYGRWIEADGPLRGLVVRWQLRRVA